MKFVINGGRSLQGEITVSGSKNGATPVIAATALTERPCVLSNLPRVSDVMTMLEILRSMGSDQKWLDEHTLAISNRDLDPARLDQRLVCKIRSSILLIGSLLARFGRVRIATPGGCHIGSRPIDTHLEALKALGAAVSFDPPSGMYEIILGDSSSATVVLRESSVTATEILLMLAARRPIRIKLAAMEPHVVTLCRFLEKLGIKLNGAGTFTVGLTPPASPGKERVDFPINNDEIEMGTFAILAAATKGMISIRGVMQDHMELVLEKLREMGVAFEIKGGNLQINGPAGNLRAAKIETRMYPGIPSDIQAPFGVLATQAQGASLIFDTLYDGRLKYIDELKKMGADATVLDPHRALVKGPTVLHGTEVQSLDLRAGATLVIAALIAKGESILGGAEQIDRGYEAIDTRLKSLGADIRRIA